MDNEQILAMFFETDTFTLGAEEAEWERPVPARLRGEAAEFDIRLKKKVLVKTGKRVTARDIRQMEQAGLDKLPVPLEYLHGKHLAEDIVSAVDIADTDKLPEAAPQGHYRCRYRRAHRPRP